MTKYDRPLANMSSDHPVILCSSGGVVEFVPILVVEVDVECIDDVADPLFAGGANEWQGSQLHEPGYGNGLLVSVVLLPYFLEFVAYTNGLLGLPVGDLSGGQWR